MRNRLTSKTLFAENTFYPGELGHEEECEKVHRDPRRYDNYEEVPGFDLPEKYEIDDKYDEIGFGIPKKSALFALSRQATTLARLFLGDDAPDKEIEDQATDFAKLGYSTISAAIRRWKATENPDGMASEQQVSQSPCPEGEDCPQTASEEDVSELTVSSKEENAGEPVAADDQPEMEIPIAQNRNEPVPEISSEGKLERPTPDPALEAYFRGESQKAENVQPAVQSQAGAETVRAKQGIKKLEGTPRLASADGDANALKKLWEKAFTPHL